LTADTEPRLRCAGGGDQAIDGNPFAAPQTADRPVIIGIRPEHIITSELVENAPVKMDMVVDLVEPMGSDTLACTPLNEAPFRIRMDGQARVVKGEKLTIGIDPARASLFDRKTEARL